MRDKLQNADNALEAALAQHTAVLGKTGSGKTSTAKLMVERAVKHNARVCILDPIKSDWWGLISSADGKRSGLPFYILGGPRGHVPLHSSAGKAIGEVVASGALPLSIIDMADFEPGGQAKFFVDFAPVLLRKMRGVVYLAIEESHLFAPKERSGIGAENMSIHWSKMIATAGRSKGIRLILITQRVQALHNALLGSCDTMIAHRLTAPADQEPVIKWLKANASKEILETVSSELANLRTGTGWLCSGEAKIFQRIEFPRITTYDNTATPTDNDRRDDVKTAHVDPDKLRAIIGDAIKDAESQDPRLLRAKIAQLEKQLAAKPEPKVIKEGPTNIKRVEVPVVGKRAASGINEAAKKMQKALRNMKDIHNALKDNLDIVEKRIDGFTRDLQKVTAISIGKVLTEGATLGVHKNPVSNVRPIVPPPSPYVGGNGATPIRGGLHRIMVALAQRPQGMSSKQLGVRAKLSSKSGTFDTYLSKARSNGWIVGSSSHLRITEEGLQHLGEFDPLPTGPALAEYWISKLGGGASRMLRVVVESYPRAISREEIGARAHLSPGSGTFDTYLSKLRALELVHGRAEIVASEEFFT